MIQNDLDLGLLFDHVRTRSIDLLSLTSTDY
jgi:hypothetical protein